MTAPADRLRVAAPLRAVDEVTVTEAGGQLLVTATKLIDATDPYLEGHYPGRPIYPGVFVVETLRQAVREALAGTVDLVELASVRFTAPLLPGDALHLEAVVDGPDAQGVSRVTARCRRADGRAAARLAAAFAPVGGDD